MTAATANEDRAVAPRARQDFAAKLGAKQRKLEANIAAFVAASGLPVRKDSEQLDPPIQEGLRMVVMLGDGTRRPDLVGQTGTVVKAKKTPGYTFVLDNGEIVTSAEVWWQRVTT